MPRIENCIRKAVLEGTSFSDSKSHTRVQHPEGDPSMLQVVLYGTIIATVDRANHSLILAHGGYQTQTTKSRINAVAQPLGYYVYQHKHCWFAHPVGNNWSRDVPFTNGYVELPLA